MATDQTTITGTLYELWPEEQVSATFRKRDFVIKVEEEYNGNVYENFIKCQVLQGKCDFLNSYKVGDEVKAWYGLQGKRFEGKKEETLGKVFYITSVNVWKLEKIKAAEAAAPVIDGPAPETNPFANTIDFPANAAAANQPSKNSLYNPSPETADDLPF